MAEHAVDGTVVEAVLTASQALVAVATQSLGTAAEDTTLAQYRALVVLASGPQRMVDRGYPSLPRRMPALISTNSVPNEARAIQQRSARRTAAWRAQPW